MRKLLIFLIVLIALLAVVDRVAVAGVERDLANRIAASAELSEPPEVSIEGIPFLTQAVSGHYQEVRFDLGTLTMGGVPVQDVRGAAYDVTAPLADILQNRPRITAGRVTIRGVVSQATVDRFAPKGVKISASGGRLMASGEVLFGVQRVKVDAQMRVELGEGGIRVIAEKIEGVPDQLAKLVSYTIPVQARLPFNVKLTDVRTVPAGLELVAEANDVPLRG
ncbi:DUF2993 domain-containing protein [Thermoactinospora rubra]|uniref:LmeA family phospholipid-binding protein n=1 Tax=Thermoactinospora rubra TaxID=1088767 RepID=UPI00130208F5|nr:DUF2993 domain-containing protein [Thermoactinospora rubra]